VVKKGGAADSRGPTWLTEYERARRKTSSGVASGLRPFISESISQEWISRMRSPPRASGSILLMVPCAFRFSRSASRTSHFAISVTGRSRDCLSAASSRSPAYLAPTIQTWRRERLVLRPAPTRFPPLTCVPPGGLACQSLDRCPRAAPMGRPASLSLSVT
jgi:hypothetical protein